MGLGLLLVILGLILWLVLGLGLIGIVLLVVGLLVMFVEVPRRRYWY